MWSWFTENDRLRARVGYLEDLLRDSERSNERLRQAVKAQETVLAEQRHRIDDIEVLRAGMLRAFKQILGIVGSVPLGNDEVPQ